MLWPNFPGKVPQEGVPSCRLNAEIRGDIVFSIFQGAAVAIKMSPDVVYRNLSGEAVLLNLATGMYFGLNEVGSRMWSLLEEHHSTEKVIERLKEEYDVVENDLRADLKKLVGELLAKGLITSDD